MYKDVYIADYKPFNFVDGEGVRCSLYVSGCLFNCKGCYNKCAQNFKYGVVYQENLKTQMMEDLGQSYCQGLSILGGEPFLHASFCTMLCQTLRKRYQQSKDIWVWTGYTFEELLQEDESKRQFLEYIDILVDGRFVLEKLDLTLQFRGSSNQRIIDVPKSLKAQKVVLWDKLIK